MSAVERLLEVVQELSLARSLNAVTTIVRTAARELTGADGATFVLRENEHCYYVDEDAIAPLWKGQRFPLASCVSGWAMIHRAPAAIEDIYADPRVPHEAYRPTFVKSMVMVPIRAASPIGAIGTYWAKARSFSDDDVRILQALADSTSVALENVTLYAGLEHRVAERTKQLEVANRELEAFSYSVSHDLRAPLRSIDGFSRALVEDYGDKLDDTAREYLAFVRKDVKRMGQLIDDLLELARVCRATVARETVQLTDLALGVVERLSRGDRAPAVDVEIERGLVADADPWLLRIVLENLIGNAFKFTSKKEHPRVRVGARIDADETVFFVEDNGAGFDMAYSNKLFSPFQRLHGIDEFDGTGIGLATVQRIVTRHGGRVWADAGVDRGATFFFTLPAPPTLTEPPSP